MARCDTAHAWIRRFTDVPRSGAGGIDLVFAANGRLLRQVGK
jgi:hypothetical protein